MTSGKILAGNAAIFVSRGRCQASHTPHVSKSLEPWIYYGGEGIEREREWRKQREVIKKWRLLVAA
jgi:hypothetical protein